MTIAIRNDTSGTFGAVQYGNADMLTVTNTGNVIITANASLSVLTTLTVAGSISSAGSQVLTSVNGGYGYNQTWQTFAVGSTRVSGTVYQNTSGKPITVAVSWPATTGATGGILYAGATSSPSIPVSTNTIPATSSNTVAVSISGVIPPNWYYQMVDIGGGIAPSTWAELR